MTTQGERGSVRCLISTGMAMLVLLGLQPWVIASPSDRGALPSRRPEGTASSPSAAPTVVRRGNLTFDGIPDPPARIRERLNQYLNARSAAFLDWEEGADGMLISTRFGETAQVHRVTRPLGAREQLTFYPEPVASAAPFRGTKARSLLLQMDRGGAEGFQLYRFDLGDGRTTLLTGGKARVDSYLWSPRGQLAFISTARRGRDQDVYLIRRPGDAPRRVVGVRGNWTPVDFSPREDRLLLMENLSVNESYVHLLELATGKVRALTPRGPQLTAFGHARFAADGNGIYVTSDRHGEFLKLYHLDLRTGKETPLLADVSWDVDRIAVSPDGRTLAVAVNEDGFSRLLLLDQRTRKVTRVPLPDGVMHPWTRFELSPRMEFSRRKPWLLGFTLGTFAAPAEAYSYDLRTRRLERWTRSEVGGLDTAGFITPTLVRYPTFDQVDGRQRTIPAFYFRPPGKGPHPVVVEIHGGPEQQIRPFLHPPYQYWLRELGVAVIVPNIRGSCGYGKSYLLLDNGKKREDAVKDIGALLDWVKTRPELDSRRVILRGGSYGGYVVLASLIRYGKRVLAGMDYYGVSSFITMFQNRKDSSEEDRRLEYGDERDPEMRKFLLAISPLSHADRIVSPLLVVQGANDPRVHRSESDQIVKAVRKNGQQVWYLVAHDEGHGFRKQSNHQAVHVVTAFFLEKLLGKP